MIVELLFNVCVTITWIYNNHFDFDSKDLKGRAEVIILDTKYSAVSTQIADIPFRMKAVRWLDLRSYEQVSAESYEKIRPVVPCAIESG